MATLGINGFGRICRLVFRAAVANPEIAVKGINEPFMDIEYMVYQLKYDSVHKQFVVLLLSRKVARKSSSLSMARMCVSSTRKIMDVVSVIRPGC